MSQEDSKIKIKFDSMQQDLKVQSYKLYLQNFWSSIRLRATESLAQFIVGTLLHETKITDLDVVVSVDKHILELQITMCNLQLMQILNGVSHLCVTINLRAYIRKQSAVWNKSNYLEADNFWKTSHIDSTQNFVGDFMCA